MKYIFYALLVQLGSLAGLIFFTSLWTALLFVGGMLAFAAWSYRIYDRHHRAEKYFGGIDGKRQEKALEAYVLSRKRDLESSRSTVRPPLAQFNKARITGHLECVGCGRMVSMLLPITGKDFWRLGDEHSFRVCPSCLEWVRSASRLESSYGLWKALSDSVISIAIVAGTLMVLSLVLASFSIGLVGTVRTPSFAGYGTFFTGIAVSWNEFKSRYAFNRNFQWALECRRAVLGLSLVAGSVLFIMLSSYLLG